MPRSHKRKRPPREIPDEQVEVVSAPEDDGEPELDTEDPQRQDEIGDANHRVKVEAEIWDTFREEFHEAVEQLPLYLHRSYALVRELDEQVTGNYNQIYPTLQKYILLRRSSAGQSQQQQDPTNANDVVVVKEQSTPPPEPEVKQASDAGGDSKSSLEPPESHTDAAPSTSRELLRHLGWLMDEVVRGSQEKVGLAQATYDSVDRHIRLLEQSIREQEMSISFGLRQGTHPSLLPDLAAPSRWSRASRVTHSPIPGLSDDEDITAPPGISAGSEVTIGMASGSNDAPRGASAASSSAKKSKKGKKRKTDKAVVPEAEAAPAPAPAGVAVSSSRGLKLKVPPLSVTVQGDAAADPNEPKYCYCNRVSFGNMVACDYPQCRREWFHLDCVGLTELPQSRTWYCQDCEPLVRKGDLSGPRRRGR